MNFIFKLTDISNIKRISFRHDINGLRAIAVLAVVFYHAEIELFKGGWLGVDIFFVISGYLISNIIISELNNGTFSFKNFYLRRVKRILPALFSTLSLTIPFAYFFLTPKAMQEYIDSLIASVFFYANYYFMNLDFYVAESTKLMPLLHTWSLAIEEQYYLLFPLFAFIVYKYFKKYFTFFIGLIIVGSLYLNTLVQSSDKFYRLEFRIWELLLGALIMILSNNLKIKHLEKIGLPLMLFPILYFGDTWINDAEPKLIALIGVSLIIFSNSENSVITKALSFKIISIIGLSSYSIYLLHQPIFSYFRIAYAGRLLIFGDKEKYFIILSTIILGYLSYIFVEKSNLKKLNYKFLFFSFSIFIIFSVIGILDEGHKSRFTETNAQLLKYYTADQRGEISESECLNKMISYEYFCNINYNPGKENLIVLGDSHLRTLSYELFQSGLLEKYNIFISIQQGCPFVVPLENNKSRANCADRNKAKELEKIVSSAETTIIFGGRFPWYFKGKSFETNLGTTGDDIDPGGSDLLTGLEKNITYLINKSKKLILIYPIPELGYFPLEPYLYKFYNQNDEITYAFSYWEKYSSEINNLFNQINSNKLIKIYPEKIFCNSIFANKCTSSNNGIFYYWDDDHLTRDGARLVLEAILVKLTSLNN